MSKSYKVYYVLNRKFLIQQPTDQSVGQRIGESHLPEQNVDIILVPRQYLDIAPVTG